MTNQTPVNIGENAHCGVIAVILLGALLTIAVAFMFIISLLRER